MERLGLLVEPAMLPITIIPKHEGMPPLLHEEGWRGVEGKGSRRGLQTSCAEGDPFAITSSAFPSMEGCVLYSGFATTDGNLVYNSSSAIVLSVSTSNTTTDGSSEAYWVVAEILDDDSSDFRCISNETSTALPYPVEATWICDVDGDGEFEFATSSQFSTSCDCSTTTVTTTDTGTDTTTTTDSGTETSTTTDSGTDTITTTDSGTETTTTTDSDTETTTTTNSGTGATTTTDSDTETTTTTDSDTETTTTTDSGTGTTTTTDTTTSATCNEGGSFTITSTVVPEVVGCYSDTGTLSENKVIYSETGTADVGQNGVVAVNIGEDSAQDIRWSVAYYSLDTTEDPVVYCSSLDEASGIHPADVSSWTCDLSGDNSETPDFGLVSDTDFSVTCGCTVGITSAGHLSTTLSTFVAVGVGFTATVVHLVGL